MTGLPASFLSSKNTVALVRAGHGFRCTDPISYQLSTDTKGEPLSSRQVTNRPAFELQRLNGALCLFSNWRNS
jgi:hypothetical protein